MRIHAPRLAAWPLLVTFDTRTRQRRNSELVTQATAEVAISKSVADAEAALLRPRSVQMYAVWLCRARQPLSRFLYLSLPKLSSSRMQSRDDGKGLWKFPWVRDNTRRVPMKAST